MSESLPAASFATNDTPSGSAADSPTNNHGSKAARSDFIMGRGSQGVARGAGRVNAEMVSGRGRTEARRGPAHQPSYGTGKARGGN